MNKIEYVSLSRNKDSKYDFILLWINRENSCNNYSTSHRSPLRLERMKYIFNSFMEKTNE
jgi:hypothetical protein